MALPSTTDLYPFDQMGNALFGLDPRKNPNTVSGRLFCIYGHPWHPYLLYDGPTYPLLVRANSMGQSVGAGRMKPSIDFFDMIVC